MATMTIQQEVEVTAELAKQHLLAFAAAGSKNSFPHPKGTWLRLSADYLKSINGLPGLPALVLTDASGTPLGCIGLCTPSGVTIGFVVVSQVEGIWDETPAA